MKKIFNLLMFLVLLASCANNSSSSTSEPSSSASSSEVSSSADSGSSQNGHSSESSSSEDGSSSEEDSSSESGSSQGGSSESSSSEDGSSSESGSSQGGSSEDGGSNSGSETEDTVLKSIADIKEVAATFVVPNDDRIYTSNIRAEIKAQLLTLQDYKASAQYYNGHQYKAFVANETGTLTISLSNAGYTYINGNQQKQQVYTFSGVVGLYNDEIVLEMPIGSKPTLHNNVSLVYDYKVFAEEETSIANIRSTLLDSELKYNFKGVAWKEDIYKIDLRYVKKIVGAVALFSDGVNVIELHGHGTINNNFIIGRTYTIYARVGLYEFRPELEYLGHKLSSENIELDFTGSPQIFASDLFEYSYEDDDKYLLDKNLEYASIVNDVYYYEGYVNFYTENGKLYLVLEDSSHSYYYSSAATAYRAQTLSIKNEESNNQTEADIIKYSSLKDYYRSAEMVRLYLTPHYYSSTSWDVFLLSAPLV